MNKDNIGFAKIISGGLLNYLKDIRLFGRFADDGDFRLYGCHSDDEPQFYAGILAYDQQNPVHGFETVEEVESYWIDGGDMLMIIDKGDYQEVCTDE